MPNTVEMTQLSTYNMTEILNLLAKNGCNVEVILLYFLELEFFPTVFVIFIMWVLERMDIMKHSGDISRLGKRRLCLFVCFVVFAINDVCTKTTFNLNL